MGLFSNTVIDKGIASLFCRSKPKHDKIPMVTAKIDAKPELPQEDDTPNLEDEYVRKFARKQGVQADQPNEESDESDYKSGEVTQNVVYKAQQDFDAAKDAEHTIFVKNVPNIVITDRAAFKEFKKLFGPEIKSVRFRSIAVAGMAPRKVAFIKQKLHPARDAVNSYIVFKNKDRVHEVMNTMNGCKFREHHLFVDSVSRPRPQVPNRSIFIGNMPFEAAEEQLFQHFAECGEIENLRIVRDRKHNLGKGFAYVQFADVSTVQLALLKNGQQFESHTLRVTRCSAKKQKRKHAAERPFKQKQTERSREGKPKRLGDVKPGTVLEGERAKAGDSVNLGRKRKPRHDKQSKAKKARLSSKSS